jgi:hypothetical protein
MFEGEIEEQREQNKTTLMMLKEKTTPGGFMGIVLYSSCSTCHRDIPRDLSSQTLPFSPSGEYNSLSIDL